MRRLILGFVCCGLFAFAGLTAAPTKVAAGSNGQQISMYDNTNWSSACWYGQNQAGNYEYMSRTLTKNAWNKETGWWWVGYVNFNYGSCSNVFNGNIVFVPGSQGPNYTCYDANNPGGAFACNGT
jgi:hypothetical protein